MASHQTRRDPERAGRHADDGCREAHERERPGDRRHVRRRADAGHAHAKVRGPARAGAVRCRHSLRHRRQPGEAKAPEVGEPETFHRGPSEVRSSPCGDTRSLVTVAKGEGMEKRDTHDTRPASAWLSQGLAVVLLRGRSVGPRSSGDRGSAHRAPDLDTRTTEVAPTAARDNSCAAALGAEVSWNRFGTPSSVYNLDGNLATGIAASHRRGRGGAGRGSTGTPHSSASPGSTSPMIVRDTPLADRGGHASAPRAAHVRRRARRARRARDSRCRRLGCRRRNVTYASSSLRPQRLRDEQRLAVARAGVGPGGERGRRAGLGRRRQRRRVRRTAGRARRGRLRRAAVRLARRRSRCPAPRRARLSRR